MPRGGFIPSADAVTAVAVTAVAPAAVAAGNRSCPSGVLP